MGDGKKRRLCSVTALPAPAEAEMLGSRLDSREPGPKGDAEGRGGCLSELRQPPTRSKTASLQLKENFPSPHPFPPPGRHASGGADRADPRAGTRCRRGEGRERE